jgi:hypothetical protein
MFMRMTMALSRLVTWLLNFFSLSLMLCQSNRECLSITGFCVLVEYLLIRLEPLTWLANIRLTLKNLLRQILLLILLQHQL